jgi:hypothetical protein
MSCRAHFQTFLKKRADIESHKSHKSYAFNQRKENMIKKHAYEPAGRDIETPLAGIPRNEWHYEIERKADWIRDDLASCDEEHPPAFTAALWRDLAAHKVWELFGESCEGFAEKRCDQPVSCLDQFLR